MHCREARRMRLAEAAHTLPSSRLGLLRAHLACCPECAEENRMDGWIERDLAALRGELPFDLDVSPRILEAVALLGPPPGERPSARLLGWAVAASIAAGLVSLTALGSLIAGRGQAIDQAAGLFQALGSAAATLLRPVWGLTRTVLAAVLSLGEAVTGPGGPAQVIHTASWSLVAAWFLAVATSVWFVGRDLLRDPLRSVGKEL